MAPPLARCRPVRGRRRAMPWPAPRLDAWRDRGPGRRRDACAAPPSARTIRALVVEGCDMTGAYITRDAGEPGGCSTSAAWSTAFAFDPSDARVIYAANARSLAQRGRAAARGAWCSRTRRRTRSSTAAAITRTSCSPATIPPIRAARDANIHAVVVDPADPRHLVHRHERDARRACRAAIPPAATIGPRLDGPRPHVGAPGRARHRARVRARGGGGRRARDRRDRRVTKATWPAAGIATIARRPR